ncbi:excinuclease, partial [Vibrio vulnificus]|nr:excinuclease [Vibrio vulnificus]
AMIVLKERAIKEGGNAVVDIKSNYKNNLTSSVDTFQCGAGAMVAGVALTGKVVKLK